MFCRLNYQVNFLSHVLLTQLLLSKRILKPGFVVNISSPVHKTGQLELDKIFDKKAYGFFQTYSNTKLFMALFSEKLAADGVSGFSFNPGTFSSGIYQLQKPWFHNMYKIAAPFMVSSDRVAERLYGIAIGDKELKISQYADVTSLSLYFLEEILKETFHDSPCLGSRG